MTLARTGSHVLVWRALQKLTGALAVLVIAHGLGPEGNGRFSLTLLLVTVLAAVLSGGVGLASVPFLRQRRATAGRVLAAQAGWLGLVLAVLIVLALAVSQGPAWTWLNLELGWSWSLLLAAVVWVMALLAFETANYDLLAAGQIVIGSRTSALRSLVHLVAVCALLLWLELGLAAAIWSMTLVYLAAAGWMIQRARVVLACLPRPEPAILAAQPPVPALAMRLVRNGWLGQLSALSYLLMLRLDQLLIESFLDVAAVGIYAMAAWGAELLWLVPEALNPLLVHSSADAHDKNRDRTAARAVRLGLWVTILAAVPLALLAQPLLGLLRGGVYLPAVPALWVLLPGIVAFVPGVILAGDFIGRGVPHWNTQASAITLAVNVLLCLLWIPRLGILGAAWSSTVAYAFGSALMIWRFRRVTGLPLREILLPQRPRRRAG